MNIGKLIRLNRLFADPSGHFCSVAVDHFTNYGLGLPSGIRHMKQTLASIVSAMPDAVTMHKGIAQSAWQPYAGKVPLILQTSLLRISDDTFYRGVTAEEAVRLGADAMAIVIYVRGDNETEYLRFAAESVRDAERFELPVICHVYPRFKTPTGYDVSYEPEDIAWATHCANEMGVDVIKVPFCGSVEAYSQIVSDATVPVVAAGGPKTPSFADSLAMMLKVVQSGARGATIGRNIWNEANISAAVQAFKYVIHDMKSPQEAMKLAGLG
jgi:DhnA family fructose-bisphosphate aldolase class Ia